MPKRPKKTGILDLRFQANLRAFRKARGLKQRELAEKMGWENENFVSQVELGYIGVSMDMVVELANVLKIDVGEFFQHPERRRFLRTIFEGTGPEGIKKLRNGKSEELIKKFRKVAKEAL
jgi:transcriptional regulator with XRE-family HTH domain